MRASLLTCAAVLIGLEVILRFFPSVGVVFGSNMDFHRYYFEDQATVHSEKVEVLFLGDSAVQNNLIPTVVADQLGMPRDAVFNLSYGAGSPNSFLPYLEGHLGNFKNLRTIVWIYNDYRFSNKGCQYHEHVTMDLEQTLRVFSWRQLLGSDVLLRHFSRLYRMLDLWRVQTTRTLFNLRYVSEQIPSMYLPDGGGVMNLLQKVVSSPSEYRQWTWPMSDGARNSLDWFANATICDANVEALKDMISLFEEWGLKFIVVRNAVHRQAAAYLDRIAPELETFADMALVPVHESPIGSVSKTLLSGFAPKHDAYFLDFQHLNIQGAAEYSAYAGKALRPVLESK